MSLSNNWNRIVDWFKDRSERRKLVRSFNEAARDSFVLGVAPTLMKASISRGERSYRHQFSDWLYTGFRIQAFNGAQLSKNDIVQIGNVILSDRTLVRKLVVLGFDTLEICGDVGEFGCHWQIRDYIQIGE